jgi:hypothetical protein
MTKLTTVLLSVLLYASCIHNDRVGKIYQKSDTLETVSKQNATISQSDTTFKLDFFNTIPDTIDGCAEYITYDTSTVTKDKYIFLSNLTDFAIIKIKGNVIYLKRDSIESKEINAKSYVAVYKGQYYKAVLTIKQTKSYDEGGLYDGTLQIIGDKINVLFKVHGESGC